MAEKIILIGNPIAGGGAGSKIKKASDLLVKKGYDTRLMFTGKKGDAEAFARGITAQPVRLVIAAGGDGTYNEVANGLVRSNIPMAILPLGTSSVLARELHIPLTVKKALEIALSGNVRTVHLGKITFISHSSSPAAHKNNGNISKDTVTRYFLLMTGIGFDAEAVFGVNEMIKKFTGKVAYFLSGLKVLAHYDPGLITLSIKHDSSDAGPTREISAYAVIIGKASRYGGTFRATPDARLSEPYFYVFATHKNNRSALFRYVTGVMSGKHIAFSDISYLKAAEIVVGGEAPVQIDGDYEGTTPAKIEIEKDALSLVTAPEFTQI